MKYFESSTTSKAVENEALFLKQCCHINLPLIYGMNNTQRQFYIVTQFYRSEDFKPVTLRSIVRKDGGDISVHRQQMRSRAHDKPAVNIKIASKMASNSTKKLNGKDRNLTNRDKYNKKKPHFRTGMPLYGTMWSHCQRNLVTMFTLLLSFRLPIKNDVQLRLTLLFPLKSP